MCGWCGKEVYGGSKFNSAYCLVLRTDCEFKTLNLSYFHLTVTLCMTI